MQSRSDTPRMKLARLHRNTEALNPDNGDEKTYANLGYVGSFTKLLAIDENGMLRNKKDYEKLLRALQSGKISDLEAVRLADGATMKYVDPRSSHMSFLEGEEALAINLRTPPSIRSLEAGAEMVELYVMELLRDVSFFEAENSNEWQRALYHLNVPGLRRGLRAPLEHEEVTKRSLLRGVGAGELEGPYISQFLYYPVPYGSQTMTQKYRVSLPRGKAHVDFGVRKRDMVNIIRGIPQTADVRRFDTELRYIYSGRSLASVVHSDPIHQFPCNAAQILFGLDAPRDPGIYMASNEISFNTGAGGPDVISCATQAASLALKHTWYHKWRKHRKVRPETYSLWLQNTLDGTWRDNLLGLPQHLLTSRVLDDIRALHTGQHEASYTLSQCYPEGAPAHPAYPSGHAAAMGGAVTVLKMLFRGETRWTDLPGVKQRKPVVPTEGIVVTSNSNGSNLVPYTGDISKMTVNSELNKYASNIALARNWAGVHYRSDATEGLRLGENVAIEFMRDYFSTLPNPPIVTLERFDGVIVSVGGRL